MAEPRAGGSGSVALKAPATLRVTGASVLRAVLIQLRSALPREGPHESIQLPGVNWKDMRKESSNMLLVTLEPEMGPAGPNIGPEMLFSKT